MVSKPFDIILIGATGFTGKRAAHYLNEHAPESLQWGIAARNPNKLARLAAKLGLPENQSFIVDTTNLEMVEEIVQQTKIIITTAGPFSLYGENVIAACAKFGTHYLDITGEVGFIKRMNEKYGPLAEKNKALMIPFSGFDSVPADIASFLLSKEFNSPKTLSIKAHYSIRGGFNGGTIATMLHKFESGEYKEMNNPCLLMDDGGQKIHTPKNARFLGFDGSLNRWTAPFIMSPINSKVVYKTADEMRKQGKPYAESISYSEHLSTSKWYNPVPFLTVSLILISLSLFGPKKWFRTLIRKIMPSPGEGPSEKEIENGYFKMLAIAEDSNQHTAAIQLYYPGDPSNKSTVFFLCESALCLFENHQISTEKSGFLTPISAFGPILIDRLSSRGLSIKKPME